ncbi:MAG: hypothetical protein ABIH86_03055 [Planctomycetota bacterium]
MTHSIDDTRPSQQIHSSSRSSSDASHLQILAICHYILAGMTAILGVMTTLWLLMAKKFIIDGDGSFGQVPPTPQQQQAMNQFRKFIDEAFGGQQAFGNLLTLLIYSTIALVVLHVFFTFLVGYCIQIRKQWLAIIIFEAMNLLSIPFGTALAVFTMVVLFKPQVKASFYPADSEGRRSNDDGRDGIPDRVPPS